MKNFPKICHKPLFYLVREYLISTYMRSAETCIMAHQRLRGGLCMPRYWFPAGTCSVIHRLRGGFSMPWHWFPARACSVIHCLRGGLSMPRHWFSAGSPLHDLPSPEGRLHTCMGHGRFSGSCSRVYLLISLQVTVSSEAFSACTAHMWSSAAASSAHVNIPDKQINFFMFFLCFFPFSVVFLLLTKVERDGCFGMVNEWYKFYWL